MEAAPAARARGALTGEAAPALDPETVRGVLRALQAPDESASLLQVGRHGTLIVREPAPRRRRLLEIDRHGTLLTVLRWADERLAGAWLRLPDRSWIAVEPGAATRAPWGLSDQLRRADGPGTLGAPLTVLEAVTWSRITRIPVLAEPARLPRRAAAAVLNLLAALAADQGATALEYTGPYPGEQLFLALLESFRYTPELPDPLAAFVAGALTWQPDPHERLFEAQGVCVHLRERVETVTWQRRTYVRPQWGAVSRHAPYRVRDLEAGVRCSLWALGEVLEDHLELAADGRLLRTFPLAEPPGDRQPLSPPVRAGVAAIVAATSAPALSPFIRDLGQALPLVWAPTPGELSAAAGETVEISTRLRALIAERLRRSPPAERPALALAALREVSLLVGDVLRARAQAAVEALPAARQRVVLESPPPPDPGAARTITAAVQAVLAELG